MSGISDAAAITWAVKSNMASSACMTNQMKMYRKGVLDGKDKDTVIDEDWEDDNDSITIDVSGYGDDNVATDGIGPGFTDLEKGVTKSFTNGNGEKITIHIYVTNTPYTVKSHQYHDYYRFWGRIWMDEYVNGVLKSHRYAEYSYIGLITSPYAETWYDPRPVYPSYNELTKLYLKTVFIDYGWSLAVIIQCHYVFHYVNRNSTTGEISSEGYATSEGNGVSWPGGGLGSNTYYIHDKTVMESWISGPPSFL